jgi:hypothetical protein
MDASSQFRAAYDRRDPHSRTQLLHRIRAEFEEFPCLRLTLGQAQRLFGLRPDICQRVLARLVQDHALCLDSDGQFRMFDDDAWQRSDGRMMGMERARRRAS